MDRASTSEKKGVYTHTGEVGIWRSRLDFLVGSSLVLINYRLIASVFASREREIERE